MNVTDTYYDELKRFALGEGMALFGVADVSGKGDKFLLPPAVSGALSRGISIGYRLSGMALETIEGAPNQIYYFHYQRVNILLDQTALKLCGLIHSKGYNALPVPASQVIDWERQLGTVSHREVARLAGLGWYGRNNLLVNARFGSQVRYATILTDMPLACDAPTDESCGTCRACLSSCPANAIGDNEFKLALCRDKLKEFTKIQKIGQMICGVCVKACRGSGK
ncbi:MAG: hypothetical protein A2219_04760 [Elusimicrobia bacterium RIFOXYA2_FULL_50_26]|nr:MAG: hypothetical protein A2219_04760 [Elusimicrobia bacterium RIFOXYA2_FULL_50_26]OGS24922.1 MAG: hypothetical protein A2314_08985 [Elusimicrobia bacterium RIFOXYB2_FULL_50_12]